MRVLSLGSPSRSALPACLTDAAALVPLSGFSFTRCWTLPPLRDETTKQSREKCSRRPDTWLATPPLHSPGRTELLLEVRVRSWTQFVCGGSGAQHRLLLPAWPGPHSVSEPLTARCMQGVRTCDRTVHPSCCSVAVPYVV